MTLPSRTVLERLARTFGRTYRWPAALVTSPDGNERLAVWGAQEVLRDAAGSTANPTTPFTQAGAAGSVAARFRASETVTLGTADGEDLGRLVLLDVERRDAWTQTQRDEARALATVLVEELTAPTFEGGGWLDAAAELASDAVFVKDVRGRYLYVNPAAASAAGRSVREMLGRDDAQLFGHEEDDRARATDEMVMREGRPVHLERRIVVQGEEKVFLTTKLPLTTPDGAVEGIVGVGRDVTTERAARRALLDANERLERRVAERTRALEHAAYHDVLTGALNRRAFDRDLDLALDADGARVHLGLIDLDRLKAINDAFGHEAGDEALCAVAGALEVTFGEHVYRFGGDEFAVLAFEGASEDMTRRVRDAVDAAADVGRDVRLSATTGAATFPDDATSAASLLRLADTRLRRRKAARHAARALNAVAPTRTSSDEGVASQAIRTTIALLSRDGDFDDDAWTALLEAAVAAVPGAEAGTFFVRNGDAFVVRAQTSFSDGLLGLTQTEDEARAWYGGQDWRTGRARIIRGDDVDAHSRKVNDQEGVEENRARYETFGEVTSLRANLCVPVLLGGHVVAQLNLDNLRDDDAFDEADARVAEDFAVQAAALLAARARRAREAARRSELEVLVRVSTALQDAQDERDVERLIAREAEALFGGRADVHHVPDALQATVTSVDGARVTLDAPLDATGAALRVTRSGQEVFTDLDEQLLGAVAAAGASALERVRANAATRAHVEELRVLTRLSTLAAEHDDPLDVAERVLGECRAFLGADHVTYFHPAQGVGVTLGKTTDALRAAVTTFLSDPESLTGTLHPKEGLIASANLPVERPRARVLATGGVGAAVLAPVVERGVPSAFVTFVWFRPLPSLPTGARTLVTRAAEVIGRALERRAHLVEVEATREGALLSLGLALELRDFETAGHTERVVTLSARLGDALGLDADALEGLRQGAYLHDVGKLGVPDAILLKPGRLGEEEWRLMQSHATTGHALVSRVPTVHPLARLVVRHHHERWDGAGYPDGLKATDIGLAARIFSVVDVFDALTSERPYKRAWTHDEALVEIEAQAGRQFDPLVVAAFVRLMRS